MRVVGGDKPTVAVLGAGFGGIAMAIKLKRAGYDFHRLREVGRGRRHVARQHVSGRGVRRTVASVLVLFELNPWWSRTYSTQPEILAYPSVCGQYGVLPHVRYRCRDRVDAVG